MVRQQYKAVYRLHTVIAGQRKLRLLLTCSQMAIFARVYSARKLVIFHLILGSVSVTTLSFTGIILTWRNVPVVLSRLWLRSTTRNPDARCWKQNAHKFHHALNQSKSNQTQIYTDHILHENQMRCGW